MTLRHAALPVGAVLLLGIGLYLFHEVHSEPAIAQVDRPPPRPKAPLEDHPAPPPIRVGTGIVPQPQVQPAPVTHQISDQIKEPPPPAPDGPHEVRFNAGPPEQPSGKVDAAMDEANRAYDHGDFDEAKAIAGKVLVKFPQNVRMLRILVSASCIDGDTTLAQANFSKLPAGDQTQMRTRCDRYGVTFPESPKPQTTP